MYPEVAVWAKPPHATMAEEVASCEPQDEQSDEEMAETAAATTTAPPGLWVRLKSLVAGWFCGGQKTHFLLVCGRIQCSGGQRGTHYDRKGDERESRVRRWGV
jgi:hypothetical protein